MNNRVLAFDTMSRLARQDWLAIVFVGVIALLFLPLVVFKTVGHGQGDVQVFFRAGWAIWTGHPLYEVTDDHGWSYHYPPTFALLMGPFANPLPGYPQPVWALPYATAVVVWYLLNFLCLIGALHLWASALERYHSIPSGLGYLRGPWLLRFGPLFALLPFVGDGLARGQPSAMLLLLIVAFFVLYVENRSASAALLLALAATIKVFPITFAVIPLLRRDWAFIAWMAGWCGVLLIAVPAICLGPTETLDLYRAMWTEHLSGIITGSMSSRTAGEVSPGAYATVSVGSVLARIAARQAFYSSPLPNWASFAQYLFDTLVIAGVAYFGRGGFWNWRGAQPVAGYPTLVAGAVLLAAMPLMISVAKPNYVTFAVPLMAVFMIETWRRIGRQVITAGMIGWMIIAWTSMIALELPWSWIKIVGPMTWALLLLGPASLSIIGTVSVERTGPASS
jgi:Glycosyltransferase family 87